MSTAILEVEGLVKHFVTRRGPFGMEETVLRAVDGVSLTVRRGEAFGLVGESGCGKSTLGRSILRLIDPEAGSIRFAGEDITRLSRAALRPLRRRAQIVFQDPYASLNPKLRVGTILAEPLRVHQRLGRATAAAEVRLLLDEVGLPASAALRFPHEFSGGQRQRIAIARALALEPELIVADEPVSALDVSIQAQILELMRQTMNRRGLSFLFISHDLGVVRNFCSRAAVMYLGRIVEIGPTAELFERPRHPYTQALLAASPVPEPGRGLAQARLEGEIASAAAPPSGCHFHPRCRHATAFCRQRYPELRQLSDDLAVACHLHDPEAADAMSPAEART